MKHIKLLSCLLGVFVVCLFGCLKNETSAKQATSELINAKAITQIINLPEEEQKTAYRLLSSHEKSYLQRNKVLNFKATEV